MVALRITCAFCGKESSKSSSAVGRAERISAPLYCDRDCSGLARRNGKSAEQKKAEKAFYDEAYRARLLDEIKAKKAAYYKRTVNRQLERERRKVRMPLHLEYCRRPEYRAVKKLYDRQYRCEKFYGEFAEAANLLLEMDAEISSRMSDYDIRAANGTLNKKLKRSREYGRIVSREPEAGAVGNASVD